MWKARGHPKFCTRAILRYAGQVDMHIGKHLRLRPCTSQWGEIISEVAFLLIIHNAPLCFTRYFFLCYHIIVVFTYECQINISWKHRSITIRLLLQTGLRPIVYLWRRAHLWCLGQSPDARKGRSHTSHTPTHWRTGLRWTPSASNYLGGTQLGEILSKVTFLFMHIYYTSQTVTFS